MADFQVGSAVDTFLRSADQDAMRDNLAVSFDTVKTTALTMTDAYQDLGNLTTPSRPAGVYVVSFSVAFTFDQINKSAYFQFRVDGSAWYEFRQENSDITDNRAFVYFYPSTYTAGIHTIELQGRKEDAAGIMVVDFADTNFQRVG